MDITTSQTPAEDQAVALMREGRMKEAEIQLRDALERFGPNARGLRLLGTVCHLGARNEEACELLEQARTLEPDHPATLLNLGTAYLSLDRIDEAKACFERIVAADSSALDAHFNLGLVAERVGDLDGACEHYRTVLNLDPRASDASVKLAALLERKGEVEAARSIAHDLLQRDGEQRQAVVIFLRCCLACGQLDDALNLLNDLCLSLSNDPSVLPIVGDINFRCGRLQQAASAYRSAIEQNDTSLRTALNLGRCLLEAGDAKHAVAHLRNVVGRHPNEREALTLLGLALQDCGQAQAALDAFEAALGDDGTNAELLTLKAKMLHALNRNEEAERLIATVITRVPMLPMPHQLRVEMQTERGDLDGALKTCEDYHRQPIIDFTLLAAQSFLLNARGRTQEAMYLLDYDRTVMSGVIEPPPEYNSLDAFNAALVSEICALPSLSSDNAASKATQNGRQSGDVFYTERGPFAALKQILWQAAHRYYEGLAEDPRHPFLCQRPNLVALHGWAVVLERAGFQSPHIHPSAWMSGVYYPQLPASMGENQGNEGWIEFGAAPPELEFEPPMSTYRLRPQEGLLVLFPSYLYHRTLPYDAETQRISIAFDFTPQTLQPDA